MYIHVPCHIWKTFNVATHLASDHHILHLASHYTAVCIPSPFHTTTSQSTTYSTSHSHSPHRTIPHPQRLHTTPTFNITVYFTPHQSYSTSHATTSDINRSTLHLFPHLTTVAQHIAYATFFITISHRIIYATFQDTPFHTTPYSTLHLCRISVTFHITPHFTSNHNHIKSRHHISARHSTFRHKHHIQI